MNTKCAGREKEAEEVVELISGKNSHLVFVIFEAVKNGTIKVFAGGVGMQLIKTSLPLKKRSGDENDCMIGFTSTTDTLKSVNLTV
jgi:hypothetical protein